jgi:hypothetical protein
MSGLRFGSKRGNTGLSPCHSDGRRSSAFYLKEWSGYVPDTFRHHNNSYRLLPTLGPTRETRGELLRSDTPTRPFFSPER